MRKIFFIFIIMFLFVILMTSCKTSDAESNGTETPPANTVYLYDNYFLPATLTISNPNTAITWVNRGKVNHTVTSGTPNSKEGISEILSEKFGSGTLIPGATFTHNFQWEGNWSYYCTFHPQQMTAVIKVKF